MDIIGKKYFYFAFSLIIVLPGLAFLILSGLNLSIDFTGGSRMEYQISQRLDFAHGKNSNLKTQISNKQIKDMLENQGVEVGSVQRSTNNVYIIKTKLIDDKKHKAIKDVIQKKFPKAKELSFETIGPTIGRETTLNAIWAVSLASVFIVLYISFSFRKVPKPASGFRFGVCTIISLLHDVLVVVGIFAILGHFFKVEIDSLFVTALLTIIGFSVHDTIVVFDRIRENLKRMVGVPFATVVNDSILQTLTRSLNTSITTLLVLFTIYIFGGESIRWFVMALLVGITSGTYSSIFNAAPILVVWEEWRSNRQKKKDL